MSASGTRLVAGLGTSGRAMIATLVVVLPSFWTMGQLAQWWTPPVVAVVVAVMLGVSLPRAVAALRPGDRLGAGAALVVTTVVATVAGVGVAADGWWRVVGAGAFAGLAGAGVWLRRFGTTARAVGLVGGLAFVAVLVAPVPSSLSWRLVGWAGVGAAVAVAWALAAAFLAGAGDATPSGADGSRTSASATPGKTGRRSGPGSSTKMAVQLAVAVAVAFAVAQVSDAGHLVWPVLTAWIVLSNNRGRGDVVWKGAQRLVGALVGTGVATVVVGRWPAGDTRAVVAVFALIAVAAALRPFGYVYWAAGVTAALAFWYGYLGDGGLDVLGRRLVGILVGGAVAVAAAWFVLPVRTTDVVRVRIGAVRRATAAVSSAQAAGDVPPRDLDRLRQARHQLAQTLPTVRAARVLGVGSVRTLATDVVGVLAAADTVVGRSSG